MRQRLAIAVLLLAGCDDEGIDLTGVYQVQLDVASSPCGADQPVTGGAPFLKFTRSELFGAPYFSFEGCQDAEGTDCDGGGGLFAALAEPIDSGWAGHLTSSSGTAGGGSCALWMTETIATLAGAQLVLDESTYAEDIAYDEATCTPDEAERRGTDMPCEEHHLIEAVKQ